MKWAFDVCGHVDGAVGMMGRDDGLTGMAGGRCFAMEGISGFIKP